MDRGNEDFEAFGVEEADDSIGGWGDNGATPPLFGPREPFSVVRRCIAKTPQKFMKTLSKVFHSKAGSKPAKTLKPQSLQLAFFLAMEVWLALLEAGSRAALGGLYCPLWSVTWVSDIAQKTVQSAGRAALLVFDPC